MRVDKGARARGYLASEDYLVEVRVIRGDGININAKRSFTFIRWKRTVSCAACHANADQEIIASCRRARCSNSLCRGAMSKSPPWTLSPSLKCLSLEILRPGRRCLPSKLCENLRGWFPNDARVNLRRPTPPIRLTRVLSAGKPQAAGISKRVLGIPTSWMDH